MNESLGRWLSFILDVDSRVVVPLFCLFSIAICLLFTFVLFPPLQEKFEIDIGPDEYDELAWNMVQGNGFSVQAGEPSVIRGPGYPAFLAAIFALSGGKNLTAVQIVQSLLCGLIVFLSYFLARRIAGKKAAILASLLMAFHPLIIWYAPRILLEIPLVAVSIGLFLLIDVLIEKPTVARAAASGAMIAMVALFKSMMLIFVGVIFILLLIKRIGLARSFGWTALVAAVAAVLIAPWTARNHAVSGRFVPIHTSLALPLACGELYAEKAFSSPLDTTSSIKEVYEELDLIAREHGLGELRYHRLTAEQEVDMDRAVTEHFKDKILANPLRFAWLSLIRAVQFWFLSTNSIFSLFMLLVNGSAILLALRGLGAIPGNKRAMALALILAYVAFHAAIIGQVRFTAPLQPLLIALASAGILDLAGLMKNSKTANNGISDGGAE